MLNKYDTRTWNFFFFLGGGVWHSSAQPSIIYLILLLQYISCLHPAHPAQWPPRWCKKIWDKIWDRQTNRQTDRQTDKHTYLQGQTLSCFATKRWNKKKYIFESVWFFTWTQCWFQTTIWIHYYTISGWEWKESTKIEWL